MSGTWHFSQHLPGVRYGTLLRALLAFWARLRLEWNCIVIDVYPQPRELACQPSLAE